ncbi:MAG TPA: phosphotransferase [Candidatus Absconditabacterales bacterium]|nr:phosphotransferase [Candidatus Absconditabacterales bacterium]
MGKQIEKQILIKILLKKGHIKGNSNFIEVHESCGNQVFCTDEIFIKVSPNVNNLKTEYNILFLLDNKHFPKPLFYEKISDNSGTFYVLGISKIKGKTLEHYREKMNGEEKNQLILNLISCMKYINSFQLSNGNQSLYDNRTNIVNQGKYRTNPNIDPKSLQHLIDEVNVFLKEIKNEKQFLIHNDIWYKNILLDNNIFSGLIDFETSYFAPIRFEYYSLLLTNYYVLTTECGDSGNCEKEFCKMLSDSIESHYSDLLKNSSKKEFICFCIISYLKKLGQYEEERYKHEEVIGFMNDIEKFSLMIF